MILTTIQQRRDIKLNIEIDQAQLCWLRQTRYMSDDYDLVLLYPEDLIRIFKIAKDAGLVGLDAQTEELISNHPDK